MARIFTSPHAARQFRRAAWRAFPREYIAAAFGKVHGSGDVEVLAFGSIPHTATKLACEFDSADILECRRRVIGSGLYYLGTLHTHPTCETVEPSEHDWYNPCEADDLVMGICALWERKGRRFSRIGFYRAQRPYTVVRTQKELE